MALVRFLDSLCVNLKEISLISPSVDQVVGTHSSIGSKQLWSWIYSYGWSCNCSCLYLHFFVISLIVHRWKFKFDFKENFTPFCEGESILRAVWLSVNVEQPNPGCVKFCHNPILVFCKTFQSYALREAEKQIVIGLSHWSHTKAG